MANDMQDEEWLRRFCKGEEDAYRIFYERYYQLFVHFAMKYVSDPVACEDIVHEVIADLHVSKRSFLTENALKSFLYVSTKNRCFNYLERKKAEQNYLNDVSVRDDYDYFLDSVIEEEVYALMHRTCEEFANPMRKIFELVLEGKSDREIADALGLSLDSVKGYKKRGKQILRKKLGRLLSFLESNYLDMLMNRALTFA